jgi:hypothetical protein
MTVVKKDHHEFDLELTNELTNELTMRSKTKLYPLSRAF